MYLESLKSKYARLLNCLLAYSLTYLLKALERHGLEYSKIETLAGVSAGSVVVAMLAVGAT